MLESWLFAVHLWLSSWAGLPLPEQYSPEADPRYGQGGMTPIYQTAPRINGIPVSSCGPQW